MSLKARVISQYQTGRDFAYLCENPPIPRNMMLELSNSCNHACSFCPSKHMLRPRKLMNDDLVKRVITEAANAGVKEIGFYSTGEPFVHKGLADFIRHAKDSGIEYTYISTNGALATPERAEAIIEAGIDSIKFSINAGSKETYKLIHGYDDFNKVVENLTFISNFRKENNLKFRLFVSCVLSKPVTPEVDAINQLFASLVDEIDYCECTPFNWPEQILNGNPEICHMPFNRIHVTCEGYLTLCCVDYQNYLAVSDLNRLSLEEAWNAPAFVNIRQKILADDLKGTLCGRCWRGHKENVKPLVAELADLIDYEAYDKNQREAILANIRQNIERD